MRIKKSTLLAKLIILILAVYATVTLLSLQTHIQDAQAENLTLQNQVDALAQANDRLEGEIQDVGTEEGLEQAARTQLGYGYEGEIVFEDISG